MADEFDAYQQTIAKTLVKNVTGAYATGYIKGGIKSGNTPTAAEIRTASQSWAKQYSDDLIKNGGSYHNGKFIPWLNDHTEAFRKEVADIITNGIAEGKPTGKKEWKDRHRYQPGTIANDLKDKFDSYRSRASTIARTEAKSVVNISELSSFSDNDSEYVDVSDGDYDDACSEADGQVWSIQYANEHELEHPNCVREFTPKEPGWKGSVDRE